MSVRIRKFSIENMQLYSTILIIGDQSELLEDLLQNKNVKTIHQSDDVQVLRDYIQQQKEHLNRGGKEKETSYVVLDNCFHSKSREFWKLLHVLIKRTELLQNNTILIVNQPNQKMVVPVDYVFVFNTNNTSLLYQHYTPENLFTHPQPFNDVYQQITVQPHQCLVLDHTQYKPTIDNSITWYKPTSSSS